MMEIEKKLADTEQKLREAYQALFDVTLVLGFDTGGDVNPDALLAGMGHRRFLRMVVDDASQYRKEAEADYDLVAAKLMEATGAPQIDDDPTDGVVA